jgi:hypothetical protein
VLLLGVAARKTLPDMDKCTVSGKIFFERSFSSRVFDIAFLFIIGIL